MEFYSFNGFRSVKNEKDQFLTFDGTCKDGVIIRLRTSLEVTQWKRDFLELIECLSLQRNKCLLGYNLEWSKKEVIICDTCFNLSDSFETRGSKINPKCKFCDKDIPENPMWCIIPNYIRIFGQFKVLKRLVPIGGLITTRIPFHQLNEDHSKNEILGLMSEDFHLRKSSTLLAFSCDSKYEEDQTFFYSLLENWWDKITFKPK